MSSTSSVSLLLGFFTFSHNFILAQMYGLYKGLSTNNFQITPPKIKKYILFLHCTSSFEGISHKNVKDATTSSFISCFLLIYIKFYISRYHFSQIFRILFYIIWKNIFITNFPYWLNAPTNFSLLHV